MYARTITLIYVRAHVKYLGGKLAEAGLVGLLVDDEEQMRVPVVLRLRLRAGPVDAHTVHRDTRSQSWDRQRGV